MCVLSSVQCVQLHCFSRPKSDRQSRLAPARPFTHAHIPPSTHVFTHTTAHADTDTAYTDNHALTQKKKRTHKHTHTARISWLRPRGVKQDPFQPSVRTTL